VEAFDDAAEEIVEAFGETFVYFDGSDATEVQAVPSMGWQRVEGTRGPPVDSERREVMVLRSAVPRPKQGHLFFRGALADFEGEFDFEVVSVRRDDEETSFTLVLKEIL